MPKRKTPEEKLDELETKQNQLKARIQKQRAVVRSQERKKDTRRKIIAGALALEHMQYDKGFRAAMERLLQEHVTGPKERELFGLD